MADDTFGIVGTVQAGAFRVDAVVAEGGFAVVYRAYHGAFRTNVALKCLKIPRALSEAEQKDFLEKFREEAEVLFRLSSAIPTVVRPLHVGVLQQTGGVFAPFMALEWLEGNTLDKLVSRRAAEGTPPFDIVSAVRLLTPVADALCRAHSFPTPKGPVTIVHRDLKPENIFIANQHGREVTRILDFGIAKVKNAAQQMVGQKSASESPTAAFTPAYGAPEQWLPKRFGQTGPWTDVWGLALTLVETLSGRPPIDGDLAAMMGSATDPVRRPTPRNEGVDVTDEIEAIFKQALAVDPRERFHDVGAFWNTLSLELGLPQIVGDQSANPSPRDPSIQPLDLPRGTAARPAAAKAASAPAKAAPAPGPGGKPAVDATLSVPDLVPDLVVNSKRAPKKAEARPEATSQVPSRPRGSMPAAEGIEVSLAPAPEVVEIVPVASLMPTDSSVLPSAREPSLSPASRGGGSLSPASRGGGSPSPASKGAASPASRGAAAGSLAPSSRGGGVPAARGGALATPVISVRPDPTAAFANNRLETDDDGPLPVIQMAIDLDTGPLTSPAARGGFLPHTARADQESIAPARKLELGKPLRLLGASVAIMVGDYVYATFQGEVLHLGPARPVWIAGPLAGIAVIMLLQRVLAAAE